MMIILSQYQGYSNSENMRDVTIAFSSAILGGFCYALWERAFVKKEEKE